MSIASKYATPAGLVSGLRAVVFGSADPRIRATWRVLLAWPVLWTYVGFAALAVGAALGLTDPGHSLGGLLQGGMLQSGLLQAGFVAVALAVWARYVDRRPLSGYGTSTSRSWLLDLSLGFAAVVAAHGLWYALGSALGWTSVEVALATPRGSLALGLAGVLVALGVNVWVQETVFFAVTVQNAAEGLASRGLAPRRAVLGALLVAVLLFGAKHRPTALEHVLSYAVAGGVFGLLYLHTGELALPIGVHLGVNYAGAALFPASPPSAGAGGPAVFRVTESLPGIVGTFGSGRSVQLLLAYGLLVGWIAWRRGEVSVDAGLARWNRR